MPAKKWFGSQNSEFVTKRHADLAFFLEELLNKWWLADEHVVDVILQFNVDYRI